MGETVGVLIPLQMQESVLYFYSFPEKQFSIKDGLKQIGTLMRKTCFSVDQGASVGMRHFPREETLCLGKGAVVPLITGGRGH